ncbi:DUF4169 family protein [Rhodobacteraceae bacterium ASV31]|nr:DUF4169 family protein [Anianabacter salinae]
MTEKVIRLGKIRKARARQTDRRTADANAVAFGRTKAEKARDKAETGRAARDLDGKRRNEP